METINVIIIDTTGVAKDIHPFGVVPVKPIESAFKDTDKYFKALTTYNASLNQWCEIDASLKIYHIESMICDSKLVVSNNCLRWHTGKSYKAILLENGLIQII